jgi:hypothetical protein
MRIFCIATCLLIFNSLIYAQETRYLTKTISLQMPEGDGKRGASVAWYPSQRKYYASFAGNADFPMAVFDENGKLLSDASLTTKLDTRGLWYNSSMDKVCANGYSESGWARYVLDVKGIPSGIDIFIDSMRQPNEQSVGTYNPDDDEVWFLAGTDVWTYDPVTGEETYNDIQLFPGFTKEYADSHSSEVGALNEDEISEDYNYTSAVCTEKRQGEIGLLNVAKKQVELYDAATGYLTGVLKLPDGAPELHAAFDFAYANRFFWIFDESTRTWMGFK